MTGFAHSLEKWILVQTLSSLRQGRCVARDIIARKGLGKWFTHRLGHGTWATQASDCKYTKHRIYVVVTVLDYPSETPFPMNRESTIRARWDFLLIKRSLTLETIGTRLEDSVVIGEDGIHKS